MFSRLIRARRVFYRSNVMIEILAGLLFGVMCFGIGMYLYDKCTGR